MTRELWGFPGSHDLHQTPGSGSQGRPFGLPEPPLIVPNPGASVFCLASHFSARLHNLGRRDGDSSEA
jgi:hypothetical protein